MTDSHLDSEAAPRRRPVIVDTDLSFDDYVALLYLLQHPQIDVRAVTVVDGVAHVGPGVENACRLLALAGCAAPVAGGQDRPMAGRRAVPRDWRVMVDYGPRLMLPRAGLPLAGLAAPELIRQQCRTSDRPVTLVALGPLTNIALALQEDAGLAGRIEAVYVSGGVIEGEPEPKDVRDWNLCLDPVAADRVFGAGVRIVLVPLNITHVTGLQPLLFSREYVRQLRGAARGRASRLMVRMIYWWQVTNPQYRTTPVWDAVVAAAVAEPAVVADRRDMAIRVAVEPEEAAGRTIVVADGPANAQVCLKGDQAAFEASYLAVARGENG